jgi:hypothetical protein
MSGVLGNAIGAYGTYSKVNDIHESYEAMQKTYHNPHLSGPQKVVHCSAEVTFIGARCGELCVDDPMAKPFINGVATVSDVGRTIIWGCNESEPSGEIILKTTTAALSGVGETLGSIAKIVKSPPLAAVSFILSIGGTALSLYRLATRTSFQQQAH